MNKKEFKFILSEGEGQFIEFKEKFGEGFVKEIVAFVNSIGGRIFLGVNDEGEIKGITLTNKLKSQIQDLANSCDPRIEISFEELDKVLIINVLEGKNKPYSCKE
ncbi:MAG: ATP-binding protein, partial [archaeon]